MDCNLYASCLSCVSRNIARNAANSHYILPSDIELLPNPGLVPRFLRMVAEDNEPALWSSNPKVFVLPIFEARKKVQLEELVTKADLLSKLQSKLMIIFHARTCPHCQRVPKFYEWHISDLNGMKQL